MINTKSRFHLDKALIALAASFGPGVLGSLATSSAIPTWYKTLDKPPFNPPSWVFGPVWTVLYAMQAVAFYLVLTREGSGKQRAIWLFCLQAAANAAWSLIFFGLRSPWAAAGEIIVLWGLIAATIFAFRPFSKWASVLLLPYLGWVSFATVLTFAIALRN